MHRMAPRLHCVNNRNNLETEITLQDGNGAVEHHTQAWRQMKGEKNWRRLINRLGPPGRLTAWIKPRYKPERGQQALGSASEMRPSNLGRSIWAGRGTIENCHRWGPAVWRLTSGVGERSATAVWAANLAHHQSIANSLQHFRRARACARRATIARACEGIQFAGPTHSAGRTRPILYSRSSSIANNGPANCLRASGDAKTLDARRKGHHAIRGRPISASNLCRRLRLVVSPLGPAK